MGGGGTMRTVAKIAGIGVGRSVPPAEHSVRNASRPVSAVLSSQRAIANAVAPLHTAASWEVIDGDELIMRAGEPMPRVVFDGVPSFQEAKAATTELKDAIDTIYLSSNSSECKGSSPGSQVSVVSPTHSESETKSSVIEVISDTSVPKHAFQALQLLSASNEAQVVVASIACDPNVWDAVMQNAALKDFFQPEKTVGGLKAEETFEKVEELPDYDSENGNGFVDFMDILHNLKLTVAEMVSSLSNYLEDIFGLSAAADADANGNTKVNFMDHITMGGTFMGLAVLVAMVVVLKRA